MELKTKVANVVALATSFGLTPSVYAQVQPLYAVSTNVLQDGILSGQGLSITTQNVSNSTSAGLIFSRGQQNSSGHLSSDVLPVTFGAPTRVNELVGPSPYYSIFNRITGTSYAWADANILSTPAEGPIQPGIPTTSFSARAAAEANVVGNTGFGSATNIFSTQLSAGDCPAGGCVLTFSFQADPYMSVDATFAGSNISRAQASLSFAVVITQNGTNQVVFAWRPDGVLGTGISGGTELADPESLNTSLLVGLGQHLEYSGGPTGGNPTSGFSQFAASTVLSPGDYVLTVSMQQNVFVVPEPEAYVLLTFGLGAIAVRRRRRGSEQNGA